MWNSHLSQRWAVLTAVICLLAAACGGSGDSSDAAESEAVDASETAAETDQTGADSDTTDSDSPGTDADDETDAPPDAGGLSADEVAELLFPQFDADNIEAQQAKYEQEERDRQQIIAACMSAQGFEYQPLDPSTFFGFGDAEAFDPSSREWVEKYGFGFSTYDDQFEQGADEAYTDPNEDYINGLSPSAQEAYYAALYGEQPEIPEGLTDEEMDAYFEENEDLFQPSGCEGEAFEGTSEDDPSFLLYEEFGDQLEELYERVQADPRVVAAEDEWSVCMAEAGYDFTSEDEIYESLDEMMTPLYEDMDPAAGMTEADFDAMTEEELDELFSTPPERDEEAWAKVQAYEIDVALASFDCRGGEAAYALFEDIFKEYQAEFIEENLGALQNLLASAEDDG